MKVNRAWTGFPGGVIGELIDRIEAATEYEPHESPLCDWCPYWDLCPVKKMPKSAIR